MAESPLMSRAEVMEFLAVDRKKLLRIMTERKLAFHPDTGQFARVQVVRIANEIEQEILYANAAAMGQQEQKMGSQPGFRQKPRLVP